MPVRRSTSDVAAVIRNAGAKLSATANAPNTNTYPTTATPNLRISTTEASAQLSLVRTKRWWHSGRPTVEIRSHKLEPSVCHPKRSMSAIFRQLPVRGLPRVRKLWSTSFSMALVSSEGDLLSGGYGPSNSMTRVRPLRSQKNVSGYVTPPRPCPCSKTFSRQADKSLVGPSLYAHNTSQLSGDRRVADQAR